MDINSAPTKGNLTAAQHTLRLAKQGYELMDKKRTILMKEIMTLNGKAEELRDELSKAQNLAYKYLQTAIIELGREAVESTGESVDEEWRIRLKSRSVMGVQLPMAELVNTDELAPLSSVGTSCALDESYVRFNEMKLLLVRLAEVESTVYRLSISIKKTAKRANALENITIPKYEKRIKDIQSVLEEKGRDDFVRAKVVKRGRGE